jgi:saccharopepsin
VKTNRSCSDIGLTTQQLDETLHYNLAVSSDDFSRIPLEHLQTPATIKDVADQTITINIPLNTSLTGTATFSSTHQQKPWPQSTDQFTWTKQQQRLHSESTLGADIPLLDIAIRKGGMITMPAETATLDLSTPYIHVPKGIWDILLLATTTEQQASQGADVLYVDCGALTVFPDLVFGIEQRSYREEADEAEDPDEEDGEDEDEGYGELVITPEQYILQTTDRKCMLLAKNADLCHEERGVVKLGWAAVRGREVVLDRRGGRVGFGKSL